MPSHQIALYLLIEEEGLERGGYASMLVLGGAHYLSVFNVEQLQALAFLFLKVNHQAAAIALVFFGLASLLEGYLIVRPTFLPRILGVLAAFGGLGSFSVSDSPENACGSV